MKGEGQRRRCQECGLEWSSSGGEKVCPGCMMRWALELGRADGEGENRGLDKNGGTGRAAGSKLRVFGGYELLEEVSRGGMGVVYRARQLGMNRVVALKMIQAAHFSSTEARLRFRMEVEAVARLDHPNIISLYESGDCDGAHYFTMRWVEGGDLRRWIELKQREAMLASKDRGAMARDQREALNILLKVVRAVHHAHQRGFLHRDLKPSNILLDQHGEPQVADFGLAKSLGSGTGFTRSESLLGSPNYMAPEQAGGRGEELTVAVDVYGLGAVMYELLTGRPPFSAGTVLETLRRVIDEEPAAPSFFVPGLDVDLEVICLNCLRKNPMARYSSAERLAEDLAAWLDGRPIQARPSGKLQRVWMWSRRRPAVAALSVALGVAVIGLLAGASMAALRINRAERQTRLHLQEALLTQVQAMRVAADVGHRAAGLRLLKEATRLGDSEEFKRRARNEMLALIPRTDVEFIPGTLDVGPDARFFAMDGAFQRSIAVARRTNLVVWKLGDRATLDRRAEVQRPVTSVDAVSADARYAILRHPDAWSVWDLLSNRRCFETPALESQLRFGNLENELILMNEAGGIRRLDLSLGNEPIEAVSPAGSWLGATGSSVETFEVAPDGRNVARVLKSAPQVVETLDLGTGRVRFAMTNDAPVLALAWGPRGDRIAVATSDRRILVRVARSGARIAVFGGQPAQHRSLVFDPSGAHLAALGDDRVVRMWDVEALRPVFSLPADGHRIRFSADGQRLGPLIRGGQAGWVAIQRPAEFLEFTVGSTRDELRSCAFSADGKSIVSGAAAGVFFSSPTGGMAAISMRGVRPEVFAVDPTANRAIVAESGGTLVERRPAVLDGGRIRWEESARWEVDGDWKHLAFAPDGMRMVGVRLGRSGAAVLDRIPTNPPVWVGNHPGMDAAAVSSEGRWVATGSPEDASVRVWNPQTGAEVFSISVGGVPRVAFSRDGRWLLAWGTVVRIVETDGWKARGPLPQAIDQARPGAAAFSPDGRLLAVVVDGQRVQMVDLERMEWLGEFHLLGGITIRQVAFSSEGRWMAAACTAGRLRIWDFVKIHKALGEYGFYWPKPPVEQPR